MLHFVKNLHNFHFNNLLLLLHISLEKDANSWLITELVNLVSLNALPLKDPLRLQEVKEVMFLIYGYTSGDVKPRLKISSVGLKCERKQVVNQKSTKPFKKDTSILGFGHENFLNF